MKEQKKQVLSPELSTDFVDKEVVHNPDKIETSVKKNGLKENFQVKAAIYPGFV